MSASTTSHPHRGGDSLRLKFFKRSYVFHLQITEEEKVFLIYSLHLFFSVHIFLYFGEVKEFHSSDSGLEVLFFWPVRRSIKLAALGIRGIMSAIKGSHNEPNSHSMAGFIDGNGRVGEIELKVLILVRFN